MIIKKTRKKALLKRSSTLIKQKFSQWAKICKKIKIERKLISAKQQEAQKKMMQTILSVRFLMQIENFRNGKMQLNIKKVKKQRGLMLINSE